MVYVISADVFIAEITLEKLYQSVFIVGFCIKGCHIVSSFRFDFFDNRNENLEQQAQALFKSWFVDFEPFGGVMPEDWNKCTLDSICSLISKGITPKYVDCSEQIVINQKCIRNHKIDLTVL